MIGSRAVSAVSYLLVYNPPVDPVDGYGLGWTLVALEEGRRRRVTNLATHGAPATASARTAQSAATRVLGEDAFNGRGPGATPPEGPLATRAAATTV